MVGNENNVCINSFLALNCFVELEFGLLEYNSGWFGLGLRGLRRFWKMDITTMSRFTLQKTYLDKMRNVDENGIAPDFLNWVENALYKPREYETDEGSANASSNKIAVDELKRRRDDEHSRTLRGV